MNYFEGTISCKAIIEAKNRKCICLYVDKKKKTRDFYYIISLAKKNGIPVKVCDRSVLDELSSSSKNGGMVLAAEDLEKKSLSNELNGYLCYVDGIEDPYNLGSIARTLYASGCNALILPQRDWSTAQKTILKASAGTFEKLPIYWIQNEMELIEYLEKYDIPLYCADRKDAISLYDMKFDDTFCMAIGGSYRGLSSVLTGHCRKNIVIEYGREFRNSLDAPSAVSVISFEILRQRRCD